MSDKSETILKELQSWRYQNRLLARLQPVDIDRACAELQGAEIIKAEPVSAPGSDADGMILYVKDIQGRYHCFDLAASSGAEGKPILNTKAAEIHTR